MMYLGIVFIAFAIILSLTLFLGFGWLVGQVFSNKIKKHITPPMGVAIEKLDKCKLLSSDIEKEIIRLTQQIHHCRAQISALRSKGDRAVLAERYQNDIAGLEGRIQNLKDMNTEILRDFYRGQLVLHGDIILNPPALWQGNILEQFERGELSKLRIQIQKFCLKLNSSKEKLNQILIPELPTNVDFNDWQNCYMWLKSLQINLNTDFNTILDECDLFLDKIDYAMSHLNLVELEEEWFLDTTKLQNRIENMKDHAMTQSDGYPLLEHDVLSDLRFRIEGLEDNIDAHRKIDSYLQHSRDIEFP